MTYRNTDLDTARESIPGLKTAMAETLGIDEELVEITVEENEDGDVVVVYDIPLESTEKLDDDDFEETFNAKVAASGNSDLEDLQDNSRGKPSATSKCNYYFRNEIYIF